MQLSDRPLRDREAVTRAQITVHGIQIAAIVLHIDHADTDIHGDEAVGTVML